MKPGDEIVVTKAEHHSVLLPFQELALRTGATLKWFDLDEEGRVRSDTANEVITDRTKIVAVTHVGNTTGAITDIAPIIRRAHEVGAVFVLDACQSVPHLKVDFHRFGRRFRRMERPQNVWPDRRRIPLWQA